MPADTPPPAPRTPAQEMVAHLYEGMTPELMANYDILCELEHTKQPCLRCAALSFVDAWRTLRAWAPLTAEPIAPLTVKQHSWLLEQFSRCLEGTYDADHLREAVIMLVREVRRLGQIIREGVALRDALAEREADKPDAATRHETLLTLFRTLGQMYWSTGQDRMMDTEQRHVIQFEYESKAITKVEALFVRAGAPSDREAETG